MSTLETKSSLTSMTATEMASRIRNKEISATELVNAHIERIEAVNPSLNALVVPLFDEARNAANQADDDVRNAKDLGPLHGVPVSIKEFFHVRGTPTTAGIQSPTTRPEPDDAPLVKRLRGHGAIVLGKTNVPQFGVSIESENPIYGKTSNPWDTTRSSGGSSGGESALISAGGSPLGLGSDGGGSIRIPSHFTGLCGLKPTTGRLTMNGHWQFPAFPSGWSVPGPLARSVDDLELAMQCLVATDGEPSDPTIAPGSIRPSKEVDIAKLRIGFYDSDDFCQPSPAIRRACRDAVKELEVAGADVVEFTPAQAMDVWELQLAQFYADGGRWMKKYLGKSPVDARIKKTLLNASLPTALRRALPAIFDSMGQKTMASVIRRSRNHHLSAFGFQHALVKQHAFRTNFLKRLNDSEIDVLICPPFATVAMKHLSIDIVLGIAYTMVFNMLGMPAGVVPFSTVQAGEESDRTKSKDDFIKALCRTENDSVGMPVGVQVVARHWREDVALAVMKLLHQSATEREDFPNTPKNV